MKKETLEEAAEKLILEYELGKTGKIDIEDAKEMLIEFAKWQQEQILQFLYSEITERRPYSSSRMCEKVVEFIEQLNVKK